MQTEAYDWRVSARARARERLAMQRLSFATVWAASGAYLWYYLFRGWFPHDDGALAQSAERVLAGELPHRDFDDLYTGGLDYLHALSFVLFGHELSSMRILLFVAFMAWVPLLYALARRFASFFAALGIVLLCVAWSVPAWTASMPSWYTLFLATAAAAGVLRYVDTGRRWYLFGVGVACGLSVVIKITGVYTLAAVVLALVFVEQAQARGAERQRRWSAYSVALAGGVVLVGAALFGLLRGRLALPEVLDFVLPALSLFAYLLWNELRRPREGARARFARTGSLLIPVALGALVPIAVYAIPYVLAGATGDLVSGLVLQPTARLDYASRPPPSIATFESALLPVIPVVAIWLLARGGERRRIVGAVALAGVLVLLLVLSALDGTAVRQDVWLSVRWAGRLFVPVAVVLLAACLRSAAHERRQIDVFVFLPLAAWTALVQFPFAAWMYFSYVVPLLFLAVLALARWRSSLGGASIPRAFAVPLVVFLTAFAAVAVAPNSPSRHMASTTLDLPRVGALVVSPTDNSTYREIVDLVASHAADRPIYAGPDSPEIYFLTGRENPTPFLFDFLAADRERHETIANVLADPKLGLAVVNTDPEFSEPLDARLMRLVTKRFPVHRRVGRFDVRWAA